MGLFTGKKGIVLGIANDRSIAWSIAEHLHREGAEIGFTHLPDTGDRPKNQNKVAKLVDPIGSKFLMPMDVCNDEHIAAVIEKIKEGTIDRFRYDLETASLTRS